MASNTAFSPKEWKVLIRPQTEWGTTEIGTDMYQLDVDSISMPSLGVNQSIDVRNTDGRTFSYVDFFQDRKFKVTEMTFSGNWHSDFGHKLLVHNMANIATTSDPTTDEVRIVSGFQPASLARGNSVAAGSLNNVNLFTVVIASPDVTSGKNMEFIDCVVTNFQLSAETGTDGGMYKYSVTLSTGTHYSDLDDGTSAAPTAPYLNTTLITLGTIVQDTFSVAGIAATLSSFSITMDHPAIWVGASQYGFACVNRGQECSVTFDSQVKYDDLTDGLINTFDTQTAVVNGDGLIIENSSDFDLQLNDYVLTNVAMSEGDIMMLDISGKCVDDGSEPLIYFDWRS